MQDFLNWGLQKQDNKNAKEIAKHLILNMAGFYHWKAKCTCLGWKQKRWRVEEHGLVSSWGARITPVQGALISNPWAALSAQCYTQLGNAGHASSAKLRSHAYMVFPWSFTYSSQLTFQIRQSIIILIRRLDKMDKICILILGFVQVMFLFMTCIF